MNPARRAKNVVIAQRYFATPKGRAARARTRAKHGARHVREHRARIRALLQARKAAPCADCGGRFDPVCMDFDHRPGTVKCFALSGCAGKSLDAILVEVSKCDVVCANRHRVRTLRLRDHRATTERRNPAPPNMQLALFAGDKAA